MYDSDSVGIVVEMLGQRKGKMTNMTNNPDGTVHLSYPCRPVVCSVFAINF